MIQLFHVFYSKTSDLVKEINQDKLKTSSDIQKLKGFTTSKPVPHEMLKKKSPSFRNKMYHVEICNYTKIEEH